MMRSLKFMVPAGLVVVATAAVASAAIPNADGSLQGCYLTGGSVKGLLRVVDSPSECRSTETPVSWSQRGPKGDPGPAGGAGVTVGGAALTEGRAEAFLSIPGVPGSVNVAGSAATPLQSFQFAMRSTRGSGAGVTTSFDSVQVTRLTDQSSPAIMRLLALGTEVPRMTITVRLPGARTTFQRFEMRDVMVSRFSQGGVEEPPLLERLELDFAAFSSSVTPSSPDGSPGTSATFGFDQVRQEEG